MNSTDFEVAFSDFIDGSDFEQAEDALFTLVRLAFKAGWLAAANNRGGARNVITLAYRTVGNPATSAESD